MANFNIPGKERQVFVPVVPDKSYKLLFLVGGLGVIAFTVLILTTLIQNRPDTTPSPSPGSVNPSPLPSAPLLSYVLRTPSQKVDLNPGILDDVLDQAKDNDPTINIEELTTVEKGPLLNVLEYLASHTESEIRANITIPHPERHPEVTWLDMWNNPQIVRGATVKVSGKIKQYGYAQFDAAVAAESGVPGFWWGNLFDNENRQYAFRILEDGGKFKVGDEVIFWGVFLKKMWYETNQGVEEKRAIYVRIPLVFARTAEKFVPQPKQLFSTEAIIFLILGSMFVLAVGWAVNRELRAPGRFRLPGRKQVIPAAKPGVPPGENAVTAEPKQDEKKE